MFISSCINLHVLDMNIRLLTQCTDMQRAMAFARILLGKISGKRSPGTGPAPNENDKTNLQNLTVSNWTKKSAITAAKR